MTISISRSPSTSPVTAGTSITFTTTHYEESSGNWNLWNYWYIGIFYRTANSGFPTATKNWDAWTNMNTALLNGTGVTSLGGQNYTGVMNGTSRSQSVTLDTSTLAGQTLYYQPYALYYRTIGSTVYYSRQTGTVSSVSIVSPITNPVLTLSAGTPGQTSLNLSWTALTGASFTEYYWEVSTSSSFSSNAASGRVSSSTRTATATGLLASTTYYAHVVAVDSNNYTVGGYSTTVSRATTAWSIPTAPSWTSTSDITNTGFTVTHTTPTSAVSYQYYRSTSNTAPSSGTSATGTGTSDSWTSSGLAGNTTYYVWVRGVNGGGGVGTWSAVRSVLTLPNTPGQPAVFTSVSQTGFTTTCTAPTNGCASYDWYVSTSSTNPTASTTPTVNTTTNSVTRTGLTPNTTYYVWVRAKNASGTSAWTSVRSGTTKNYRIYYWNGSSWVAGKVRYWNGSSWVDASDDVRYWDGSSFV